MSRWSGFHGRSAPERLDLVARHADLTAEDRAALTAASALTFDLAEGLIENAVGSFPLPLGFAVNLVVDGEEVVAPMAVEESSVVAAASHGAKWAAATGGFTTETTGPITTAQVELRDVPDLEQGVRTIVEEAPDWAALLNGGIPAMVERGGGVQGIEARIVADRLVVHVHVDCRDAMGANLVNGLAEELAPLVAQATGGRAGLRILTNLATGRLATARCRVRAADVGGPEVVRAMVEADRFAQLDPYRAATHNKGVLNGIDPVVVATGNDWRAVEAGAHAYAARDGAYRGLTTYRQDGDDLEAELTLPLAVGTVGGVTRVHPVARACLKVLGSPDAMRLAGILASVGLAQNLAAVRALSAEGIQQGHMALHARNLALQAGLAGEAARTAARRMVQEGKVTAHRARELAGTSGETA